MNDMGPEGGARVGDEKVRKKSEKTEMGITFVRERIEVRNGVNKGRVGHDIDN